MQSTHPTNAVVPRPRAPRVGHGRRLPRLASLDARLALLPSRSKAADESVVQLAVAVTAARAAGATWQEIADAIGVRDPKVAWKRYCDV